MSLFKKILIGGVIYLVFLLALLPAKVALWLMPLPEQVQLSGVEGSVWSGEATSATFENRQFEQIHWDINPWPLALGQLSIELKVGSKATAFSTKGHVLVTSSGVSLSDMNIESSNGFLIGNTRMPFRTKVGGDVSLFIDDFVQGLPLCEQLTGKLFLHNLQVNNQFGDFPLGEFELNLGCKDGQIALNGDERHNKLGLSGSVLFGENNRYRIQAKIKPIAEQPEDIRNSLNLLGQPDNQGYYKISFAGALPKI
ncbi:type II secretion system protein N [Parashewanella spongiae]|uniref:Type II secretion system protein N n=1 Tax=Parashewanella spongiae TaxID=342950 RepID=A0A3A6U064_9GAMM|nr:type II secretion system protein N [Parashewanella spongiae]MCL1077156.1 type II secretion system protein N [Parashewanella spongiae]RJY18821.1 type II secretion system protein N [Parashewanella spongiae]